MIADAGFFVKMRYVLVASRLTVQHCQSTDSYKQRQCYSVSSGGSRISERGANDEAPQAPRSSRRRREDRGAEGVGCGEGCPSPLGEGSGEVAVPPPQKMF